MNHSTIKNFNSSSSSQGAEGVARSPSPPILIPEARPIQEDQVDAFSQVLVTSLSCPSFRKSYGATAEASMNGSLSGAQGNSLDHGMPTLEPAMKSLSSCEQDESLPSECGRGKDGTHITGLTLVIAGSNRLERYGISLSWIQHLALSLEWYIRPAVAGFNPNCDISPSS